MQRLRSGFEGFGALADNLRDQSEEIGRPWMRDVAGIYFALSDAFSELLQAEPEYAIPIVDRFSRSPDVNTRFVAAKGIKHAYKNSPERSHALIARLLTDGDERIRHAAHGELGGYASTEGIPVDSEAIVDVEFIASLPVDGLIVNAASGKQIEVLVEPATAALPFYPFSYDGTSLR